MNLKQVSYKGSKVTICYEVSNDESDSFDQYKITSEETPHPEFDESLQALKPHLLSILELPEEYGTNLTVTKLAITQKGSSRFYSIVGNKILQTANAPFNIVTPLKPDVVDEGDGSTGLSIAAIDALKEFEHEAKKYAMGQRSQSQLDL